MDFDVKRARTELCEEGAKHVWGEILCVIVGPSFFIAVKAVDVAGLAGDLDDSATRYGRIPNLRPVKYLFVGVTIHRERRQSMALCPVWRTWAPWSGIQKHSKRVGACFPSWSS